MSKLEPIDKKQCQAEITPNHGPFSLGPPMKTFRCKDKPFVIATEKKAGKDGKRGSMSICAKCLIEFKKRMPKNFATFEKVKV